MRRIILAAVIAVIAAAALYVVAQLVFPGASTGRRPPLVEVPPLKPATRTSTVVAPTAIALSAIRAAIDAAAPRNLEGKRDNPLGQLLANGEFGWTTARGPMVVTGRPEGLTVSTELTGTFRVTGQIGSQVGQIGGALGGLLGESIGRQVQNLAGKAIDQRTDVRGTVVVTSRPALTPEWRLEPNLTAQVSLADAALSLAGVRLSVRNEVKPLLEKSVADQLNQLQGRIRSDPFIEQTARREWAKLCRAIALPAAAPGAAKLWLEVRPTRAYAAQPRTDASALTLVVGVQAETRIVPNETKPNCPFPAKLEIVPQAQQGRVAVAVPIDVPFTEVNRLLDARLKGRTFPEKGDGAAEITVRKASVAPSGDRLLISLLVKAREKSFFGFGAEANVYVRGRPVLDRDSQVVRLTDIDLDVDSEAALGLLGAAARAALPYLRDAIAENAAIDLKPFAAQALNNIDAAMADFRQSGDGIRVDVKATEVRLVGIEFDARTLRVVAEADGTVKVAVTALPVR